jgi:hypothetical protein
MHDGI